MKPEEIERESFRIIEEELRDIYQISLPQDVAHIIKRVIHATADFGYAHRLYFSPGFMEDMRRMLEEGDIDIVTDTSMVLSGINKTALKKAGGSARCYMLDEDVAEEASARGTTRAAVAMEHAALEHGNGVYVTGNAPTALFSLYDLYKEGRVRPRLLIAAPVGFVNVIEAKKLVMRMDGVPMVVARGRQGGSNVAAAIMNAILYG